MSSPVPASADTRRCPMTDLREGSARSPHIPDPKPGYVADWDDLSEWRRQTDADIFECVEREVQWVWLGWWCGAVRVRSAWLNAVGFFGGGADRPLEGWFGGSMLGVLVRIWPLAGERFLQQTSGVFRATGSSLQNSRSGTCGCGFRPAALPWGPHRPYEGSQQRDQLGDVAGVRVLIAPVRGRNRLPPLSCVAPPVCPYRPCEGS